MGLRNASKKLSSDGADARFGCRAIAAGKESVSDSLNPNSNHLPDSSTLNEPKGAGVRAALFALSVYKSYLSVLFAGSCRFEPTCSRYAYEAIERFGVLRGVWLGMKRLARCHPLSGKFGFDPIPEKREQMHTNAARTAETREVRP
jgi:uncharacterized protein